MKGVIAFLLNHFEGKSLKFSLDSDDDGRRAIEGKLEIKDLKAYVVIDLKEIYDEVKQRV
jgi:hypothetical protein